VRIGVDEGVAIEVGVEPVVGFFALARDPTRLAEADS